MTFSEVVDRIEAEVFRAIEQGDEDFGALSQFEDCVYLKNSDFVVVGFNEAYRKHFAPGASPRGRTGRAILEKTIAEVSIRTDELIAGGCPYIECEHTGRASDGVAYHFLTQKRCLKTREAPGITILGVTRVLEQISEPEDQASLEYSEVYQTFHELDERDKEICRLTALGESSRDIAEKIGMTTRGIELRRQKAFASLGVVKTVDLVRLLVRLQDRGYLDLGL